MIVGMHLIKTNEKRRMFCHSSYLLSSSNQLGVATILYRKHYKNRVRKEDIDLPTFHLSVIAKATENFSSSNKLVEGGFGPVIQGNTDRWVRVSCEKAFREVRTRVGGVKK